MNSSDILEKLNSGVMLLMDGGTGSELQRRGVDVSKGANEDQLGVWSATANLDAPDVVQAVHEDYYSAGADLVTSNSFWTNRPKLELIGEGHRWEEYTKASAKLAINARQSVNPKGYVAGGIAPPRQGDMGLEAMGDLREEFENQSRVLSDSGVDLILAEYVRSVEDAVIAVESCAVAGLPVFLGVCHVSNRGLMQRGETFTELTKALRGRKVDAVLLMCSSPDAISASLPRLREAFEGTVGAYANVGYAQNPRFEASGKESWHSIDDICSPSKYAEFTNEWKEMGASIIGGCCATTPKHIEAIRPIVKGE